jgi:hypothetical protein
VAIPSEDAAGGDEGLARRLDVLRLLIGFGFLVLALITIVWIVEGPIPDHRDRVRGGRDHARRGVRAPHPDRGGVVRTSVGP